MKEVEYTLLAKKVHHSNRRSGLVHKCDLQVNHINSSSFVPPFDDEGLGVGSYL